MAKPGGDRKTQGQGINILNPNAGAAPSVPYQTGGKNAPSAEEMIKGLKAKPSGYVKAAVPAVKMGTSKVFTPQLHSGQG